MDDNHAVLNREKRSPTKETEPKNEKNKCVLNKLIKVDQKEQKLPTIKDNGKKEEFYLDKKQEKNSHTFLYGPFDVTKNLKRDAKAFIKKKFSVWFKAFQKLKLFTKNLNHLKDQISKTVGTVDVSKIPKKLKKVHLVLTYQRNGQVKFRDFGLKYTSDPEDSKIKTNTCFKYTEPSKKKPKRTKRQPLFFNGLWNIQRQPPDLADSAPSLVCAEVGSNENTVTIRYGPFEIASVNPEEEIEKQFRRLFKDHEKK